MLKNLTKGISAGLLISLGSIAFLSCENKYIGSALFSLALMCICMLGYNLYTGKICYIIEDHSKASVSRLLLGLLGNLTGTFVFGYLIRTALPSSIEKAYEICSAKLEQTSLSAFIRAFFCGILIYLAVEIYRKHKRVIGILILVPAFILCGFEHSVADMCYFTISGIVSLKAFLYIWLIILGNTVGGIILPLFELIGGKNNG